MAHDTTRAINIDLCNEAIRLTRLICEDKAIERPDSHALLALMLFNAARFSGRQDASGALLLLVDQKRSRWDKEMILTAMTHLAISASGNDITRYHLEANIAAQHCIATSYKATNWTEILASYQLLEQYYPTSLQRVNQAVVVAEIESAQAGLDFLEASSIDTSFLEHYAYLTTKAFLLKQTHQHVSAKKFEARALKKAPSDAIRRLIAIRLQTSC